MAADASLVNASFNLGKARAGANTPNMAPLMQANVGISASFLKIAEGAMGNYKKKQEIKRVGKEKQLKGFEKIFSNTLQSLYEQEEPLPQSFVDMLTERVEGLQTEFETYNTYGKGDTAENNRQRARLTGELKRITNEINNFRGGLMKFGIDRKQGLLNEGLIKQGDIAPAQQVLDLVNFDKNVAEGNLIPSYGEDGKIQILSKGEWGEVIVTMESLNKAFPPIDTVQDTNILNRQTESGNTGKADGLKQNPTNNYDYDQRYSEYLDGLDTDDAVSNIVARKIKGVGGNNPSFKDALLSDITIPIEVLDNMFYDDDGERVEVGLVFKEQLDIDGKEGITSEDYDMAKNLGEDALAAFEENLDKMIDAITNDENIAYDRGTTAKLLATYLTNMDKEKYDNNYNAAVKSKGGGKSGNYTVNGREMTAETFQNSYGKMVKFIEEPEEGQERSGNGYNFKYIEGQHYREDKDGNYTIKVTPRTVAKYTGLLNYTTTADNELNIPPPDNNETPNVEEFAYDANIADVKKNWAERYKGMGFTVSYEVKFGDVTHATITAYNGKTHKTTLGRRLGPSKKDKAADFNEFINANKKPQ